MVQRKLNKKKDFTRLKSPLKGFLAMNKGELVEAVQETLGGETTKKAAEEAVAAVLKAIETGVIKDETVQIIGFGSFVVRHRAARNGINPKTKEPLKIPASKTVAFKPAAAFKEAL